MDVIRQVLNGRIAPLRLFPQRHQDDAVEIAF